MKKVKKATFCKTLQEVFIVMYAMAIKLSYVNKHSQRHDLKSDHLCFDTPGGKMRHE